MLAHFFVRSTFFLFYSVSIKSWWKSASIEIEINIKIVKPKISYYPIPNTMPENFHFRHFTIIHKEHSKTSDQKANNKKIICFWKCIIFHILKQSKIRKDKKILHTNGLAKKTIIVICFKNGMYNCENNKYLIRLHSQNVCKYLH